MKKYLLSLSFLLGIAFFCCFNSASAVKTPPPDAPRGPSKDPLPIFWPVKDADSFSLPEEEVSSPSGPSTEPLPAFWIVSISPFEAKANCYAEFLLGRLLAKDLPWPDPDEILSEAQDFTVSNLNRIERLYPEGRRQTLGRLPCVFLDLSTLHNSSSREVREVSIRNAVRWFECFAWHGNRFEAYIFTSLSPEQVQNNRENL